MAWSWEPIRPRRTLHVRLHFAINRKTMHFRTQRKLQQQKQRQKSNDIQRQSLESIVIAKCRQKCGKRTDHGHTETGKTAVRTFRLVPQRGL